MSDAMLALRKHARCRQSDDMLTGREHGTGRAGLMTGSIIDFDQNIMGTYS